ncbi:MAG: S53 family peptidase [Thermoplasmata archaeon]|nr:S53 family peptidase [Thermoplasmata archaeon]
MRTPIFVVFGLAVLLLIPGTFALTRGSSEGTRASADLPAAPMLSPGASHPMGSPTCSKTALCPTTVRSAYNFTRLLKNAPANGTGQTIVIVDACGDPHIAADLANFDSVYHLPVAALNITAFGTGTTCRNSAWSTETSLDVEWAHVLAPGAKLHLIVTTSGKDHTIYGAWNLSITQHFGEQISNSWGGRGSCGSIIQSQLRNATAAGVTVLASGGDAGAWGLGTSQIAQNPADCPSVLTVGGTTLRVGAHGAYASESAWSGSGGGYVTGKAEPSYQSAAKISDPSAVLGKPDVAAVADPSTGVWVYNSNVGGWFTVGGTSVACPMWAALVADVNALRAANNLSSLGDVNAYLYTSVYGPSGSSANYSKEFHDVVTGSNGWSAGTGWDAATGIGSFDAYPLAKQLGTDPAA